MSEVIKTIEERAAIRGELYPQRLNPLWKEENNLAVKNARYIRTYTVWAVVLFFFIFSFVGWAWEVSIHLVEDGEFVNRGVMHGPWLPVYDGGVSLILVALARWRRSWTASYPSCRRNCWSPPASSSSSPLWQMLSTHTMCRT